MRKRNAPHIHRELSAPQIYLHVLVALLPCCVAAVFFYGLRAAILIAWSALLFFILDRFISVEIRQDKHYYDLSGIISGIIIALLLPPNVSLVTASVGVIFASLVIKQFFGGVGSNLFNPALAGRAFIEIVYSEQLRVFSNPGENRWVLHTLFTGPGEEGLWLFSLARPESMLELFSGSYPGLIGVTGAVFALLGGVYLLIKGIIRPHAILSFLVSFFILYWVFFAGRASFPDFLSNILSHGVLFIAVFGLNDYTTMPSSRSGRVFFGIGVAFLMVLMKTFSAHVGALLFPVLAMNTITPIVEFYVRPIVFGRKNETEKAKEMIE